MCFRFPPEAFNFLLHCLCALYRWDPALEAGYNHRWYAWSVRSVRTKGVGLLGLVGVPEA